MNFEIGKLINYDGLSGDIISKEEKYIFLKKNKVNEYEELHDNQTVVFEPQNINGIKMAVFVQPYDKYIAQKTNPTLIKKYQNYDIMNKE